MNEDKEEIEQEPIIIDFIGISYSLLGTKEKNFLTSKERCD